MDKITILENLLKKADATWARLQSLYPTLREHKTPEVILNNRLYRTAGRAFQEDCVIELASKFLLHSQEFHDTMYHVILPHELAHVADFLVFGESEKKCGHGQKWRDIMLQLGLEPDPFHTMDLTQ